MTKQSLGQENSVQKKSWFRRRWKLLVIFVTLITAWVFFDYLYFSGAFLEENYWAYQYQIIHYVGFFFLIPIVIIGFVFAFDVARRRPLINVYGDETPPRDREAARQLYYAHEKYQSEPPRTIKDILVSGHTLGEVKDQVHQWVAAKEIVVEEERNDFFRGKMKEISAKLSAPKHFEVSMKSESNGILVHTEGWVSLVDYYTYKNAEISFSNQGWIGRFPRKKGWKIINDLWSRLEAMSKAP
jgi:hypothetical protein